MNNLKILKFGGTSVGSRASIHKVLAIVNQDKTPKKVIVVSAPNGITDLLLESVVDPNVYKKIVQRVKNLAQSLNVKTKNTEILLAGFKKDLNEDLPEKEKRDLIASFGERFSVAILTEFFQVQGLRSRAVDARQFIITNSQFTNARINYQTTCSRTKKYLEPILKSGKIPIVTGFIAKNSQGKTTTLGRGGSDLTATLLARCLSADLVELWTDSNGVMTADPRLIKNAQVITKISFEEVMELSNFGAKVVYHRALEPVLLSRIPVKVLNTFNPDFPGTLITDQPKYQSFSVTGKKDVVLLTIFTPEMIGIAGYLGQLFAIFKKLHISVDVIAVSEASISLSFHRLDRQTSLKLKKNISSLGEIEIKNQQAIVSVISSYLKTNKNLIAKIINQLNSKKIDIEVISYGNTKINLMFIIQGKFLDKATKSLHQLLLQEIKG